MRKYVSFVAPSAAVSDDAKSRPTIRITEEANAVVLSCSWDGFFVSKITRKVLGQPVEFTQVKAHGTGWRGVSGRPLLPSLGRFVQIPLEGDYSVSTEVGPSKELHEVHVMPAQEKVTDDPKATPDFEYDPQFYQRREVYPEHQVEVLGPFAMSGCRVLLVQVCPFAYFPANRHLKMFQQIRIKISFSGALSAGERTMIGAHSKGAFCNLCLNASVPPSAVEEAKTQPMMLIIHAPGLGYAQAALAISHWRLRRDKIRGCVVSIDTVGNSVASIKKYIRDHFLAFEPYNLRYVLLLGDVDTIASEIIPQSVFGSNITDYYYSTAVDPAGPEDLVLPSIAVGRIPVRTQEDALAVARQIIEYEKDPPSILDSPYYKRMTFAAFFQDDDFDGRSDRAYLKTMEGIRSHLVGLGMDVQRVYVSTVPTPRWYWDGSPVPVDVQESILSPAQATQRLVDSANAGQLLMAHRDHGDVTGWSMPPFGRDEVDMLTGRALSVFFSVNCLTGMFDLPHGEESFAERVLRRGVGAPSLIASTRVSGTWRNDRMMEGLFDALWPGVIPHYGSGQPIASPRLGDILNYAKAYVMATNAGSPAGVKDHFEIYHVFGDPAMKPWTKPPWPVE